MNYIFFLIPILLVGFPVAFGEIEIGKNFDRELIEITPDGAEVYRWTSQSERISVDEEWINYQFTETVDYLRFESEAISFEFYKATCDFKLYEVGLIDGPPVISSYSTTIAVNGIPINIPVCVINDVTTSKDGVDFNVIRGPATIFYELDYATGAEWTYEVVANGVITITEVCTNCIGEQIEQDNSIRVQFDDYTLDTKNEIHGAFKEASQQSNDYWIKYEAISDGTLIIDPTFSSGGTWKRLISSVDPTECTNTAWSIDTTTRGIQTNWDGLGGGKCRWVMEEIDVSSIPTGTTVTSTNAIITVSTVSDPFGENCDIYIIDEDLTDSANTIRDAVVGATKAHNSNYCSSTGTDKTLSLTPSIVESIINSDTDDIISLVATELDAERPNSSAIAGNMVITKFDLEVTYASIPNPDAVDDLTSTDIGHITVDLSWSQPNLNTGNLTGYQVNYTSPWSSSVTTIITNNTENSDTTTQVSGLSELTPYSFRIGVWTEGFNGTGNVLNITTLEDFVSANFTPGFFDLNATNPDVISIFFERIDINNTALFLNVTYPNTFNLSCDFSYQFANINQTYTGLSTVVITSDTVESSFQFIDVDNEIINVYCWDENNLANDGSYIITQLTFPLLQQIIDFRSGEFGTQGNFGAIDLVTLAVVIISMIGFNRINESVGAIFNIIFLGALAYFSIIELPTIIFGAIAVVLMLVITSTRKT